MIVWYSPFYLLAICAFQRYTDRKQPEIEAMVEAVLDQRGIFYDKSEVWIPDERLYEVLYTMEVLSDE